MATDWTQFTPVDEPATQPVDKKKTDWSQFTPVEDSGALRGVADTGLSIGRGLATGAQMVADSFGANNRVSRGARKIAEGLGKLKSDQSQWETQAGAQRMDAAEASGSKLNEFAAGVKNFADQPVDMLAEGVGSSAPTLAAAALTRGRVNPLVTGAGMGGVQGAGAVKGQIHEDVKRRHIAAGLPEAESEARAQAAQAYSGENSDQIALGAGLGALAGTTGAESAVSRLVGHTGKGGLKNVATGAITEGGTEFAQGGQERLAANVAAQREGFDADTWQGVVGQGTMEGLAGAGSGAAFGAVEAMASRPEVKIDPNAGAISKALSQHPEVTPAAAPGALIPPPVAEPEVAIDPATTGQANYARVVNESAPMPLEKAQNIAFQMNAGGNGSFYVAPHGNAGFTVVPSSWLTDGQLAEFSSVQGDGGMLPAPAQSDVMRVDAAGNAAPETLAQAEELAAIRQRLIDMGKQTPRGFNPNADAASISPNKSEDIAGDKIDRKWTAFDQASGTLGIDRAQMPQIKSEHRGAMVNFLNARGITSEQDTVLPTDLKATQREFSPQKVEKAKGFTGNDRSILVSADGHVLDGHHQWLAKRESGQPVKVIRLNAPIRELLEAVSEFPSAQTSAGATPRAVVENAPGPRGIVETVPPRALIETAQQGVAHGATGREAAALAQAGGEGAGNIAGQGVPAALALPSGRGLGDPAAGTGAGGAADLPAGPADRNDAVAIPVIARVGTTPNSADPVTVRAGVVHVGEYPAQDFETGEDITVPEGATFEQVADALRQGRVLSSKQRIYAGAKGMRQAKATGKESLQVADVPQPDRRVDSARRKAVAEMDVETLRRELLTDHLTGLGNRRAYDESEKLPAQVSIDADSLKWVNDNLGHDSGDKLLKAIGQALGEETANAYHVSGDEFIVQAATEAEAQAIMDRAVSRMAGARIEATDAAGRDIVLTGVGVSYGIAGDLREAEKRLGQHKADRETQGQRAARGEVPPNAAVGSGRGADQPGDAAAEAGVDKPFDSEAWNKERDDRIAASKAAGNKHLDDIPAYVETMRGLEIYNAHDHKERGTVRTVANTGEVVIHWADQYSADKNLVSPKQYGKKTVFESWLMPSDLKDYVVGKPTAGTATTDTGRPDGWSTNAIKAGKVMKDLGIPRADGMKLADMVAAIEAHDAERSGARRPRIGDPGYTLEMAEEDLDSMLNGTGEFGRAEDARLTDRINRQEKLIAEMKDVQHRYDVADEGGKAFIQPALDIIKKELEANGQNDELDAEMRGYENKAEEVTSETARRGEYKLNEKETAKVLETAQRGEFTVYVNGESYGSFRLNEKGEISHVRARSQWAQDKVKEAAHTFKADSRAHATEEKPAAHGQGLHYASGYADFEAGKPRKLPSYFTKHTGKNPKDWFRGWDAANAAAPVVEAKSADSQEEKKSADSDTRTIFEALAQKSKRRKTIDSLESHPLKDAILTIDANFQKIAGHLEAAGFVTIDCGG